MKFHSRLASRVDQRDEQRPVWAHRSAFPAAAPERPRGARARRITDGHGPLLPERRWSRAGGGVRLLSSALLLAVFVFAQAAQATAMANIVRSSCSETSNKLRYDCSFETDLATTVRVEWDDGTTVRSTPPSAFGLHHHFRLVGMRAGVVVRWRAQTNTKLALGGSTATGSFTTLSLDTAEQAALTILPAMGGHTVQSVLFPADCGGPTAPPNQMLFIADPGGQVVWYQDPSTETGGGSIGALNVTEHGTILAIHHNDIVEYTLEGDLVTHLDQGVDFTGIVHHDVFRRGDRLFALSSVDVLLSDGTDQQYDGVLVFDGSGLIDSWDASELYIPAISAGAYDPSTDCYSDSDCTHTNALWVGRDDTWTMSLRTPGRVIQVDGDPASPTYGQLLWDLDGQGVTGDFALVSSATIDTTFEGQHNVQFLPNGKLLMWDNEFQPHPGAGASTGMSRGLEIRLVGGYAAITHEYNTWSSGALCFSRGSTFKIDGPHGNVLTTCADGNTIQEVDSMGRTLWEAQTSCSGTPLSGVPYRTIPIELP